MRNRPWYPVAYMFAVTAACSGILIVLNEATAERVGRNKRIFRERAVVAALGLADDEAPAEVVHRLYLDRIRPSLADPNGPDEEANVVEYRLLGEDGDSLAGYGVPLIGRGYWDMIHGVIGIRGDRKTVIGIAFYQQHETPGLGAEIAEPESREQFRDKQLAGGDTPLEIAPPTSSLDASSVHAVTGATQTSSRLNRFLNEQLAAWRRSKQSAADREQPR